MAGLWTANSAGKVRLIRAADGLVMAAAASLPWSTSATAILVVLWLLTLVPTVSWAAIREEFATLAGGLPVLLVAFGVAGMLWADVTLIERWKGFESFLKLLMIPALLVQFRRSGRGECVFAAYLLSCVVLLAATTIVIAIPSLASSLLRFGNVLVKNAPTQSGEFVTCIFGLLYILSDAIERRRLQLSLGCVAVILGMLANILYVSTGRTALVVVPILTVLFAIKKLSGKGAALISVATVLIAIVAWSSSPYLRARTIEIWTDLKKFEAADTVTSSGERLIFWRKSAEFILDAPVIGHGTGSIHSLFKNSAVGQTGSAGVAAANPHNQTLAVAIQLGLVGATALWAMWIAHLVLFRGNGLAEWIGLVVVVQNIVGSLFNSHLFDFVQGWVYVIGVGVAGGIALKNRERKGQQASNDTPRAKAV